MEAPEQRSDHCLREGVIEEAHQRGTSSSPAEMITGVTPISRQQSSTLKLLPQPFFPQTPRMRGVLPRTPTAPKFLAK